MRCGQLTQKIPLCCRPYAAAVQRWTPIRMIPAVGEHPGVAVLRLHYSKPCFALTAVVCAETAYVCMLMCLRVCVCVYGALWGLLLEGNGLHSVSAKRMRLGMGIARPTGERSVSTAVWPTGEIVNRWLTCYSGRLPAKWPPAALSNGIKPRCSNTGYRIDIRCHLLVIDCN